MSKRAKKCPSCKYRADSGAPYSCDYAATSPEHKTRTATLGKGANLDPCVCPLYEKGKRLGCSQKTKRVEAPKAEKPPKKKRPLDKPLKGEKFITDEIKAEYMRLYEEGHNDKRVAEETGTSITSVRRWRQDSKLPPAKKREIEKESEGYKALYILGIGAEAIARLYGRNEKTVKDYLKSQGLKGMGKFYRSKEEWEKAEEAVRALGLDVSKLRRAKQ